VGPLIATAIVAVISNGHAFENGRQFSGCLGLVPRQNSSGGIRGGSIYMVPNSGYCQPDSQFLPRTDQVSPRPRNRFSRAQGKSRPDST
jgi:hypothetical protein